ncbi:hypothetical protein SAMN05216564_103377 [Halopenitus persicus]|uniref:Uncharacterized protein n=1 Tax=Halopenitus persicus TaxID=1048396 RepID=A0A1H3HQB4_9EURY|nr:hypothetical protein SAMN05216564_103377 [Halopenitus persicus]
MNKYLTVDNDGFDVVKFADTCHRRGQFDVCGD